jgi:hypothetical protein
MVIGRRLHRPITMAVVNIGTANRQGGNWF